MLWLNTSVLWTNLKSWFLIVWVMHTPPTPVSLVPTLEYLALASGREDWSSIEKVDVPLWQPALSRVVDQACFDFAVSNAPNVHTRALALSFAISHAGNCLRVVTSIALDLHLRDWEFLLCFQHWLARVRMLEEESKCPVCQEIDYSWIWGSSSQLQDSTCTQMKAYTTTVGQYRTATWQNRTSLFSRQTSLSLEKSQK